MLIKNANVLGDDFKFSKVDIEFDEKITNISENLSSKNELDATDMYVIPGFIDLHTHGCDGVDGCDANLSDYEKMAKTYAKGGTTSFLLTTMTLPVSDLENILEIASKLVLENDNACRGIYLEGPFFNVEKKGAQYADYMKAPSIEIMDKFIKASQDTIKIIAFAPEISNSDEFIKKYSKKYAMSLAHTMAKYDDAMNAINLGVKSITHLFNAMPIYKHRDPGVIGAAFDSDVYVEIISDGVHLHPAVIRNTFKQVGEDRAILVSDSIRATGLKDGEYSLGGQKVTVNNNVCLLENGAIAGSATNLYNCVSKAIEFGIKTETAIKAATINPAKMIGIDDMYGSIAIDKYADLLLVDKNFNLKKVFIKGKLI